MPATDSAHTPSTRLKAATEALCGDREVSISAPAPHPSRHDARAAAPAVDTGEPQQPTYVRVRTGSGFRFVFVVHPTDTFKPFWLSAPPPGLGSAPRQKTCGTSGKGASSPARWRRWGVQDEGTVDVAFSLSGPPFRHFMEVPPLDVRRPLRPLQPSFGAVWAPVDSPVLFMLVADGEAFTKQLTLRVRGEASTVAGTTICDIVTLTVTFARMTCASALWTRRGRFGRRAAGRYICARPRRVGRTPTASTWSSV